MKLSEHLLTCAAEECAELLEDEGILDLAPNREMINAKKAKIRRYMEVSRRCGTLDEKEIDRVV
jgi:hypothetical protein